jgi:hypothetical protein
MSKPKINSLTSSSSRHSVKSSIPVNCCGAHHAPVAWPPFIISRPIGGPVLILHIRAPLPIPCGSPAEGPAFSERDLPSRWTAFRLSMLQLHGPVDFRPPTTAQLQVLSTCICQAQGCCCRWWRGRPSWWVRQGSACCQTPPRSMPHGPWAISQPTSRLYISNSPTSCCAPKQSGRSHWRPNMVC